MTKEELFKLANICLDIKKKNLPIAVCEDELFCRFSLTFPPKLNAFIVVQRGIIKEIEIHQKNDIIQTVRL